MEPLNAGDPAQIGAYQLVGGLGANALGRVYAGRGPDGRLATVTLAHPHLAADPRHRDQLRRDVAAVRRTAGSPYVLPVDADTEGPTPWTAVGGADAPTLATAVAESGPLPPHALTDLATALVGGLAAVGAAGLRVSGLEPSHVVMTPEGPRLSALGLLQPARGARAAEEDAVYVLGALLHFAGSGRPPAPPAAGWAPAPPPPVADPVLGGLINQCLNASPAARPTLRTLASRLQGLTGRALPLPRAQWWRGGSGQLLAVTAALAVLAIGLAVTSDDGDDKGLSASPVATSPGTLPSMPGIHKGLGDDDGSDDTGSSAGSDTGGSDSGTGDGSDGSNDGSDEPDATPSQDAIDTAAVGDCFDNSGTESSPDLSSTICGPGTFETLQVLHGTTDTHQCDNVPKDSWNVAYLNRQIVLCLSYEYEHGTAYYAKPGACVWGTSATSDWNENDCETGAFTVLRRLTGTTDTGKCKGVKNSDWSEHFGVTGRTDLGVTLCLSMNYPDDAGHAVMNECMKMTGASNHPVLHSSSCGSANIVINGITHTYNNSKFCGNNGWSTWKPNYWSQLAYTVCYRWK